MQTFRISNTKRQNYYAIRIFGIVHLIGAIGLVVLLDGPSNGLRWGSCFLIAALLASSAYLLVRVIQARLGRIDGHYVLTHKTLAIMLPRQPRRFIRKRDCTGFLPGSLMLVLRNEQLLRLDSASSKPYLKDLVSGVFNVWWPGTQSATLCENSFRSVLDHGLNLRIDFRSRREGFDPMFVYTRQKSRPCYQSPMLILCKVFLVYFLALPVPSMYNAIVGDLTPGVLLRLAILSLLCLACAVSTQKFRLHILRQIREFGTLKDAYVISSQSMAVLRAGHTPAFYRSEGLIGYHLYTGQLNFQDGRSLLAAPYLYGDRYDGMLRCLFMRWRPSQQNLLMPRGATSPQGLLFVPLAISFQFWTISGSDFPWDRYWTDAVGNASCMLIIFFMTWSFARKHAANQADVSVARGEGNTSPLGHTTASS